MFVEPAQSQAPMYGNPQDPAGMASGYTFSQQPQQQQPYGTSSRAGSVTPPSRASPTRAPFPHASTSPAGSLAVRSLRRSISGPSQGGTPRAAQPNTNDLYDISATHPEGAAEEAEGQLVAAEADDFAHELLAMNTLAMQRCRAEDLEAALQILNGAYVRIADCEQNGGQVPVMYAGVGVPPAGVSGGSFSNVHGGSGAFVGSSLGDMPVGQATAPVAPQLLDQLKATTLNNMGVVECHRGQPRQALSHFEGARQLEEGWNMCSPSVALNTCAAYNALGMYDKATAAALETIDMLRTLELQRKHQDRQQRRLQAEQQQQQEDLLAVSTGATRRAAARRQEENDAELEALIAAGQPQIADSDNKALWGAAWHNLAVAQVNTARQASHKSDVSSEFTNSLKIFQNAMKATQELLGVQHPMTKAVTETYRAVRTAMRTKGAFTQHRTLMTAPPLPADPRELELARLSVQPAAGMTRHATVQRQRKDLTITFRGPVTHGVKLVERVEASAYPGAAEEAYQRSKKKEKSSRNKGQGRAAAGTKGCSSLRSMPLSGTLAQASEVYGNPHPLLYSGVGAGGGQYDPLQSQADDGDAAQDGVSWGSGPAAVAAPPPRGGAGGTAKSRKRSPAKSATTKQHKAQPGVSTKKTNLAATAPAPAASAKSYHLPSLNRSQASTSAHPTAVSSTVVDQSKLLLLAQPPAQPLVTASARTTYYPIDVPPHPSCEGEVAGWEASDSLGVPVTTSTSGQPRTSPATRDAAREASPPHSRDANVIWKSANGAYAAAEEQHRDSATSDERSVVPRQPTRPTSASATNGRRTKTPTPVLEGSQKTTASSGGGASVRPHLPSARLSASAGSEGRRSQPLPDNAAKTGALVQRQHQQQSKHMTSTASTTSMAVTGGVKPPPRELFDAVWVTADTHYIRSGNRIFGQAEYDALHAGSSSSTAHTPYPITPHRSGTGAGEITNVMTVDAEGGLLAISAKSPTPPRLQATGGEEGTGGDAVNPTHSPSHSVTSSVAQRKPPYNIYRSQEGTPAHSTHQRQDEGGVPTLEHTALVAAAAEGKGDAVIAVVAGDGEAGPRLDGTIFEAGTTTITNPAGDAEAGCPSSRKEAALTPMAMYSDSASSHNSLPDAA